MLNYCHLHEQTNSLLLTTIYNYSLDFNDVVVQAAS